MVSHPPLYAYHGGITKEQTVMFWPTGVVDDTNPVPVCHKTTPTPSPLSTSPTSSPTSSPLSTSLTPSPLSTSPTSSPPENAGVVFETNLVGHLQPPIHRLPGHQQIKSPGHDTEDSRYLDVTTLAPNNVFVSDIGTNKSPKQCIDFILFDLN